MITPPVRATVSADTFHSLATEFHWMPPEPSGSSIRNITSRPARLLTTAHTSRSTSAKVAAMLGLTIRCGWGVSGRTAAQATHTAARAAPDTHCAWTCWAR